MLQQLKALVPKTWLSGYHRVLSWSAAVWYGHPSNELYVIGITGTNGKTTTSYLTAKALEASGFPTACTTTAIFKIGDTEWLNDKKMTMLGRFQLQKMLREMVKAGCRYAVIETSSQGVVQHRHSQINYDVAVFTNLTPEHIEAHGGFENYKQAKLDFFRHVAKSPRKVFNGKTISKVAVLNADDPYAKEFSVPGFDEVYSFTLEADRQEPRTLVGKDLVERPDGVSFQANGHGVRLSLLGRVNVKNALAALSVCDVLNIDLDAAAARLTSITAMPGRFERIDIGQPWTVMVDYAFEPTAVELLYQAVKAIPRGKLIHVLGSAGGGRDVARRPVLGRLAAQNADLVIVTNEDPYDDDPKQIIEQVAAGAREMGKKDGETLLVIDDRREAIMEAMRRAEPGDLVLLTGKGSEQAICIANGKKIGWDERQVAKEAIAQRLSPKA